MPKSELQDDNNMRILLINPPFWTIPVRFGTGHQMPLGLLMVGGPLLDQGHEVKLLDAERRHLRMDQIIAEVRRFGPRLVMTGHVGSTAAHATCLKMLNAIKTRYPEILTVYGGVYPTFHALQILTSEKSVDVIVCGEGEATAADLMQAIQNGRSLQTVKGIGYRKGRLAQLTPPRPPISDLDAYRIAWELIADWDDYRCFGLGRAGVIQFSRGCPHQCTFCGQQPFWRQWRCRDPISVVDEIEYLYRRYSIRFFSLADENPAADKSAWRIFLSALAARRLPVYFFASIRTTDIVRDADILHLYRKAKIQYILLGIESTQPEVLQQIRKGSTTHYDLEACRLLKKHGLFSIVAFVIGLRPESRKSFREAGAQLSFYDGTFVNITHVTPHPWTRFGRQSQKVDHMQRDLSKWDYRHQVLVQPHLSPWQMLLAFKWLEFRLHCRADKWRSFLMHPDRALRHQLIWSLVRISLVWITELTVYTIEICIQAFCAYLTKVRELKKLSLAEILIYWGKAIKP